MAKLSWFLYSDETAFSGKSFARGIEKIGDKYLFRNPMAWNDYEFRQCDIAVVFGWRKSQQDCLRSNTSRGVPTVVVDLGYVDRFEDNVDAPPDTYLQVSLGDHLNIIPKFPCPSDRFRKLCLRYPGKRNNPDGYALFCGQWPTDAAHPFNDELSIKEYIDELRRKVPDIEIKYRCHPRLITNKVDKVAIETDFKDARCVITWNSNSGHDALREGLPVFCDASAPYAELSAALLSDKQFRKKVERPSFPTEERWTDYFTRLAYGQWTFNELASGECQSFILGQIEIAKMDIDDSRSTAESMASVSK